ncbi:MAG: hypothetical protein F6K35_46345, partial [Okeania sp. SIO2H7]|nr:hypothetical protein [Okeania sp. SIO2H7]
MSNTVTAKNVVGKIEGQDIQVGDRNFFVGETHFDEISFEDLESQIQQLPEIQPDFLDQLKEHSMLVL